MSCHTASGPLIRIVPSYLEVPSQIKTSALVHPYGRPPKAVLKKINPKARANTARKALKIKSQANTDSWQRP